MFSPLESEVLLGRDVQQGVVRTEELINLKIQFSSVAFRKENLVELNIGLFGRPAPVLWTSWAMSGSREETPCEGNQMHSSNFTGWEAKLILISDLLQVSLVFQIACLLCSHLPPTKKNDWNQNNTNVWEREGRNQWTPPLLSSSVLDRWRNESGQCYLGLCLRGGALANFTLVYRGLPWSTRGSLCQFQLYNVPWCKCIFVVLCWFCENPV